MDLSEIYQQTILDHKKHPHNLGEISDATNKAEGYNPICGDHIYLDVITTDNKIKDIKSVRSVIVLSHQGDYISE